MRTAGIICEYNPFHFGHQFQIRKTREILGEDTAIVCLMSGNFVQRGEPAVFDKRSRAMAAIQGGADLVLELPITTAVNAAGYFASGAVKYLDRLGCIDYLSFGSECGDLEELKTVASLLDSGEFEAALAAELSTGLSYAAARTQALEKLGGRSEVLKTPNNALAVEYLRALSALGSKMEPLTIPRDPSLSSASSIREGMGSEAWKTQVPGGDFYEGLPVHTLNNGEKAMLAVLRTLPEEAFRNMAFDGEGLWSKVMKACRRENSVYDIIMSCKSKRYAFSRLRRTLLCLFLGLDGEKMKLEAPYLRVLAFNDRGRAVLRRAGELEGIELVSGAIPKTGEARAYFELESRASDLYTLFAPEGGREPWGQEKAHRPAIQEL